MTANNHVLALAAVGLLSVGSAHATLATAASFDEKVENAASIVFGKCVKSESHMDPSGRWVLTYSTFNVEKAIKGNAVSQITIVTPGGQVGSVHQDSIGIPQFRAGDEHILFVKNSSVGPTVLYFEQGAYDVTTDEHGEKIVAPVPSSVVKIDTQRGMAVPAEMPRTLRQFETDVNQSMHDSRQRHMQMELIEAKRRQGQASLGSQLLRYKYIIALAVAGIALATWRLLRR